VVGAQSLIMTVVALIIIITKIEAVILIHGYWIAFDMPDGSTAAFPEVCFQMEWQNFLIMGIQIVTLNRY
jgi:hypothetical protein